MNLVATHMRVKYHHAITSIVFIIIIGVMSRSAKAEIVSDPIISLHFQQVDVSLILQTLAEHNKMNLIFTDDVMDKQTIKLDHIQWSKALKIITQSAKLESRIEDNILFITPKPDQTLQKQKYLDEQKQAELALPLQFLSFNILYGEIKDIFSMLEQQRLLSERGSMFIDERSNTLMIHDIPKHFATISSLLNELDKPIPQVHLSAHIVTINRDSLAEFGVKWGYNAHDSQLINSFSANLGVGSPTATLGFTVAKWSGQLLNLELAALEAENQLTIIASPNLLTSHQHTASIKQGTEIPYEIANGRDNSTSIQFKQAVLGLEVTPRVLYNEQLELALHITQNTPGAIIKRSDGGEALAIDTQEIRTHVLVKSGETLVLGGIFQQTKYKDTKKVPGIGDLPIIGNLFSYNSDKQQRRELIIFITPELVAM